jgi:hypothetical protein
MPIHIGAIIKEEAKNQSLSQAQVAEKINAKNPQNVDYDFGRESLPIDKILRYSEALNKNFVAFYYNEEPLKTYREQEFAERQAKTDELQAKLEQAKKLLVAKEETIATQKELIETQRKLIEKQA